MLVRKLLAQIVGLLWRIWDIAAKRDWDSELGIETHANINYLADGNQAHRLDVFRTPGATGQHPAIITIHGGGLFYGKKNQDTAFCQQFAARGFVVFNIDYRLVPKVSVGDQLQDVAHGINWVVEHAVDYHVDLNRLCLVGESAGGLLATTWALAAQDAPFAEKLEIDQPKISVKALGLISPMMHFFQPGIIGWGLRYICFGTDSQRRWLQLLALENLPKLAGLPPVYCVSSDQDLLRPMSAAFVERLQRDGAEYEFHCFGKTGGRRLDHIFSVTHPRTPQAQQVFAKLTSFFNGHIPT